MSTANKKKTDKPSANPAVSASPVLVGLDLGTNKSCLQAASRESKSSSASRLIPTMVGYAKDGLLDGILPGDSLRFYGQEAIDHRLHLRLVPPLRDGVVSKGSAAKDYLRHLRTLIGNDQSEARAVIGLPANADAAARDNLCRLAGEVFDRVIPIPEPFLAALGMRDESRVGQAEYFDPVRNSLFIDIGAGTIDLCLVQGCYPAPDDQISLRFGGDQVDELLAESIHRAYPECDISLLMVRELKERLSFVGEPQGEATAKVIIGGKTRALNLTEPIREVCEKLLDRVFDAAQRLIARASSDSVGELLQNIVLTGGGSRIRNLGAELQRRLYEDGFEKPRVVLAGEDDAEFVARGALKAARSARESQWQQMPGAPTAATETTLTKRHGTTFARKTDTAFRRRSAPVVESAHESVPAH